MPRGNKTLFADRSRGRGPNRVIYNAARHHYLCTFSLSFDLFSLCPFLLSTFSAIDESGALKQTYASLKFCCFSRIPVNQTIELVEIGGCAAECSFCCILFEIARVLTRYFEYRDVDNVRYVRFTGDLENDVSSQ